MVQYGPIISNFVLEVKLLLFQPWPPPTSARRLLVLRHGPSARLQGVAIVAGYEPCSTLCLRPTRSSFRLPPTRSSFLPYPAPAEFSACLPCRPTDTGRNPHCNCPYPPHPHALRYGRSGQATVYLASRIYGHCRTSRTGLREARSQRRHVAERSATEFIELYSSTTPMHRSHCSTPHSYTPTRRTCTCMPSESKITVIHLLLS